MVVTNDSYLIKQIRCPECAKLGKDNNKDNLAVYSDGHSYCYSCGYTVHINKLTSFGKPQQKQEHPLVMLPYDCDVNYPHKAIAWVEQYELGRSSLLEHNVLWSEKEQRLIFPVFGDNGVIAWQGRYFGEDEKKLKNQKWFGKGDLKNTFHILGKGDILVLTEDIISSIKCSKFGMSMCLFGSHIGVERFQRLYKLFKNEIEVVIWLDYDKASEAVKESRKGQLVGLNTRVIITEKDPKELTYKQIEEIL